MAATSALWDPANMKILPRLCQDPDILHWWCCIYVNFIVWMMSSTRRAHTKSRKGCQTCKNRKVRCDEYFPQCRNCTKRGLRCAYLDDPAAAENTSLTSSIHEFNWPAEIEVGAYDWQQTKQFPFPHLQLTAPPNPGDLSTEECRLLFHICTISEKLEFTKSTKFTTWAHKMPEYAVLHLFWQQFGV